MMSESIHLYETNLARNLHTFNKIELLYHYHKNCVFNIVFLYYLSKKKKKFL